MQQINRNDHFKLTEFYRVLNNFVEILFRRPFQNFFISYLFIYSSYKESMYPYQFVIYYRKKIFYIFDDHFPSNCENVPRIPFPSYLNTMRNIIQSVHLPYMYNQTYINSNEIVIDRYTRYASWYKSNVLRKKKRLLLFLFYRPIRLLKARFYIYIYTLYIRMIFSLNFYRLRIAFSHTVQRFFT